MEAEETEESSLNEEPEEINYAVGWNLDNKDIFQGYLNTQNNNLKIIQMANEKKPLSEVIGNYNLNFEISSLNWKKARCPFPDHDDHTPSFGYNAQDNRFHCFGCSRSGGTVQFLSGVGGRETLEVAQEILASEIEKNPTSSNEILTFLEDSKNLIKITNLMLEVTDQIRSLYLKLDLEKKKLLDNLLWGGLDLYLFQNIPSNSLDLNIIQKRIEKIKEYLNLLEKNHG